MYCKKDKSLCSFEYNEKEDIIYYSLPSENVFGINEYGKCRYDKECLGDRRCRNKNFWGVGYCDFPPDSTDLEGIYFLIFFLILLFTLINVCCCICIASCINHSRNKKRVEKGLSKKEYASLKPLKIICAVVGFILLLFLIITYIDSTLNKKS